MKALTYLLLTTLKNNLRQLLKNPPKLVLVIIVVAAVIFTLYIGISVDHNIAEKAPLTEVYALVFGLFLLIFVQTAKNGFGNGASFFTMPDVNLIFTGPFSSRLVLLYGLIRQMGISLWVGFFLLFQYSWLSQRYGLSLATFLAIILVYCLVFFCGNLTAMVLYAYFSNDDGRSKKAKNFLYLICILLVLAIFAPMVYSPGQGMAGLAGAVNAAWVKYIPVLGWAKALIEAVDSGSLIQVSGWLLLNLLYILVLLRLIIRSGSGYYEDVLSSTEAAFRLRSVAKEGKQGETVGSNVKVGKTGLSGGQGPGVMFYKHLLENRRGNKLFLDGTSLIFLAMTIAYSYFMRNMGIISIFAFATYMQIFSVFSGRWVRELSYHYIYLIPAGPFSKLISILKESILKAAVDSFLTFFSIGIILQLSSFEIICCILARFGFALIFMAVNIFNQRVMGGLNSRILKIMVYFLFTCILAGPGVVLGIFLAQTVYTGFLLMFIWNTLISALIVWLCRNILQVAEMR